MKAADTIGPLIRVPKLTGTHADPLLAVGLADLLECSPLGGSVRIEETPAEFVVVLPRLLHAHDVNTIPQDAGYPYLCPNPQSRGKVPSGIEHVDYPLEKERGARYYKQREALKKAHMSSPEIDEQLSQDRPRADWRLLQALNALQGDDATNRVIVKLASLALTDFHALIIDGLSALEKQVASGVDLDARGAVQLFVPSSAKGYARLKPDSTDRGDKTVAGWSDDFAEWLRFRGYFRAAVPRMLSKDVRVMVPAPARISSRALARVARQMQGMILGKSRAKVDVLASLSLARLLVRHSEEFHDPGAEIFPGLALRDCAPRDVLSGVYVTHYQNLGSAKAVSATSVVALPGWFPIKDKADAELWMELLDEHTQSVRGLDREGNRGDEQGLIANYRRFLQARGEPAAEAFVDFLGQYGVFRMRAQRARAFRTDRVRRILMAIASTNMTTILDDDGFRAVAGAVRRATVSAQAMKSMGRKDYREIRYGLLADLRRTGSLGTDELAGCISDFVSKYNNENARRREVLTKLPVGKRAPANVTTDQLRALLALVDAHGGTLVGSLLAAYGSCKEPFEPDTPEPSADPTETTTDDDETAEET